MIAAEIARLTQERDKYREEIAEASLRWHDEHDALAAAHAEIARLTQESQELRRLLGLVEAEQTEDQPRIEFFSDPVEFHRSMAARLAVSRDELKHQNRALAQLLEAKSKEQRCARHPEAERLDGCVDCVMADIGASRARAEAAASTLAALRAQVKTVVDTFTRDEALGFRSRDRQFAIEVLTHESRRPDGDGPANSAACLKEGIIPPSPRLEPGTVRTTGGCESGREPEQSGECAAESSDSQSLAALRAALREKAKQLRAMGRSYDGTKQHLIANVYFRCAEDFEAVAGRED